MCVQSYSRRAGQSLRRMSLREEASLLHYFYLNFVMHLSKAYSGMFTYCLMMKQLVYLLGASVFKLSSFLFMRHIETSFLCVMCILVTMHAACLSSCCLPWTVR